MITIEEIKKNSQEHPLGGRFVKYGNDKVIFSVVGGRQGLYGNFEDTFELAIIDVNSREFITKLILNVTEDICPWVDSEELVEVSNKILSDGFQFFTEEKKIGGGTY